MGVPSPSGGRGAEARTLVSVLVLLGVLVVSCRDGDQAQGWVFLPTWEARSDRVEPPQEPPTGVIRDFQEEVVRETIPVWWTGPGCRFLAGTPRGLRLEVLRVSCGGEEPGLETRTGTLLPEDDGEIQEIAAQDWSNLWVVTRSRVWSITLPGGEVSLRSVEVPRRDWRGAWRDPGGELNLLDSGGEVWGLREGHPVHLIDLNLPEDYKVGGDCTWNPVLGAPVCLLEGREDRTVRVGALSMEDGSVTPLGRVPEGSTGVATSGWLWVLGRSQVSMVNPLTGEVEESWLTGDTGPLGSSLAP